MNWSKLNLRNPNLSAPTVEHFELNTIQEIFKDNWWTGVSPEKCLGFDDSLNALRALPLLNLKICSREDVLNYFDNTWTLTEILFSSIKDESTYIRPPYHQLRHPLIFYYGHTAVLFINKLRLAGVLQDSIDLYLEKVLETGVDEMSWDDMSKNEMVWPTLSQVHSYRKKVYSIIKELISSSPSLNDCSKIDSRHAFWALFMGFEHEKIHFETSSVLIRELPVNLLETPKYWVPLHESAYGKTELKPKLIPKIDWHKQSAMTVSWGKNISAASFGWDNEYGSRTCDLSDFIVSQDLISNAQYFEFVSTSGYLKDKYWSEEGVLWRNYRNSKRPCFWVAHGPEGIHEYKLRTIFSIIDMPWSWPAEVNYHEASAYCRWKQELDQSKLHYRLITEAEHVALRQNPVDEVLQQTQYSNQSEQLRNYNYNYNFQYSSPTPVGLLKNSNSVNDLFGNIWQWAEDQFNPLPGFETIALYDDFSTPCFDGKHQMLLGGSFISCGHEASVYARFQFRPHFFQHAGFRISATADGSSDNCSTKLISSDRYIHPHRKSSLSQMSENDWWKKLTQPLEISPTELSKVWSQTVTAIESLELDFYKRPPIGSALDPKTNKVKSGFSPPYQPTRTYPVEPQALDQLLNLITQDLTPLGQSPGNKGYLAYVAGAGNAISNVAQALTQTINQFTGHYSLSPGLVALEQETLHWILSMANYNSDSGALFTSGGSLANLQALAIARNVKLKGHDLSKARYYCSEQAHHCIGKALALLGFPKNTLQLITNDENQKMDLIALEKTLIDDRSNGYQPICIIGTAGSTNTGTIDPLLEIGQLCKAQDLWFHIDAAYGGFFLLTKTGRSRLKGFELSDSAALDPHKSLSIPYGTGCLIVKNQMFMQSDYSGPSTYMPPSSTSSTNQHETDFADISMELSRDSRGLRLWLPLKYYGIEPFQLNLEEKLLLTHWLYENLSKNSAIHFANSPDLTILTFRLINLQTKALLDYINLEGSFFLTSCTLNNDLYIRICLLGFRTHFSEVEKLYQLICTGIGSQSEGK